MRSQAYSLPTRIEEESGLNIEIHRQYIGNREGLDSTNGQPIRTEKMVTRITKAELHIYSRV